MQLHQYLDNLNKMAKEHPEILEYDVIYSSDDEGNSFEMIYYTPSVGVFENREFSDISRDIRELNAICIN